MGIQFANAKSKPLCFDFRREILCLPLAVICRFLSTSQFYNFYDTKIRITLHPRQRRANLALRGCLS